MQDSVNAFSNFLGGKFVIINAFPGEKIWLQSPVTSLPVTDIIFILAALGIYCEIPLQFYFLSCIINSINTRGYSSAGQSASLTSKRSLVRIQIVPPRENDPPCGGFLCYIIWWLVTSD